MTYTSKNYIRGILRIALGWIFFWAFLDKLFGLGFATEASKSWLAGTSPTAGFLTFGTKGPLAEIFQAMAGNIFVDWLFMMGLLLIGLALIIGIGMTIATWTGSLLMLLLYLAAVPPAQNPLIDQHIVYIFILWLLYKTKAGYNLGLGKWWSRTSLVQKYKFLQ